MEILEKRIHKIIARISDVADFRRIAADALRGESEAVVSGLSGSGRALFIAGLWQSLRRPLIVVTPQDRGVEALATDLSYFHSELNATAPARVCPFPAWETDPYAGLTPHADVQQHHVDLFPTLPVYAEGFAAAADGMHLESVQTKSRSQ